MKKANTIRPAKGEYAEYYHGYISRVGEGDIVGLLRNQIASSIDVLSGITEKDADFRYQADKWSIKELVGHLIDTERVMVFRALAFARGDDQDIGGMDQDLYVSNSDYSNCTLKELTNEFGALRTANAGFFANLPDSAWNNGGNASGVWVTVRALAYIVAGHELHHMHILKEKYLPLV